MFSRIFNYDNPVFRAINKIGSIWVLNILWVLCSIPIVTMGASTTALLYSCMKLQKDEGYPTKNFFKSFRENFGQATGIFLLYAVVGALLMGDLIYWNQMDGSNMKIVWAVTIALLIPYVLSLLYVFAVQSKFVNTVKRTIHYSFILSIKHFKYTFPMFVIVAFMVYINVMTVLVVNYFTIGIGIGITAYILSLYYAKIFENYIKTEDTEEIETENLI
ncbi:MAG: YesL family protein [Lachnospiraceae bacterium]|nr:YesL family protein [Lachnospiraceae bacterium]